jgi:hypothetical protein
MYHLSRLSFIFSLIVLVILLWMKVQEQNRPPKIFEKTQHPALPTHLAG